MMVSGVPEDTQRDTIDLRDLSMAGQRKIHGMQELCVVRPW